MIDGALNLQFILVIAMQLGQLSELIFQVQAVVQVLHKFHFSRNLAAEASGRVFKPGLSS